MNASLLFFCVLLAGCSAATPAMNVSENGDQRSDVNLISVFKASRQHASVRASKSTRADTDSLYITE